MFKKGDKVIVIESMRRSEISFIEISPTSLLSNKVIYFLKGFSNLPFMDKDIELDKQEMRNDKLNLILDMVKYGDSNTYSYKLDDERLRWLVSKTNRSVNQTQFLFNLVDGDFSALKRLEEKIKNTFYGGCPSDREEVDIIMLKNDISDRFKLDTL